MSRTMTSFFVLLAFAYASQLEAATVLTNGGFETVETYGGGFPTMFGLWQGNVSYVVESENGITPFQGDHMLKFVYSDNSPNTAGTGRSCQLWQLIDLSPYKNMLSSGKALLTASAYFNRVPGDSQTDRDFNFTANAYAGTPDTFVWSPGLTAPGRVNVESDGDTSTWELLSFDMLLPKNADYVALQLATFENTFNDTTGDEFDGHYADAVMVTITPEPTTPTVLSSLLIIGIMCLCCRRKR